MCYPTLAELPAPPPGKTGWPWTKESPQLPERMVNGQPWPRVSVVTPSFNQGEFIEETIRSVLLQGYPDLEYIIMDGGSSDGSVDLIRKYEPWLAGWVSEPDRGQTHAINKGWQQATGDLLAYINTDDCYLDGALLTAAQEFWANPDIGMIYGTATVVDEAGQELRTWKARPFDLKMMLTAGNIVPQPAAFFSAGALKQVGYLNEEWHMIMDYELCLRLGQRFPAVCVPRTLARFRDHAQSKTRSRFAAMATELVRFLTRFSPDHVSPQDLQTIKQVAVSRVHYEWALAYLVQGRQEAAQGLSPLLSSLFYYPAFALRRPLQTAYIVKEIVLSHIAIAHQRFMVTSR